MDEKLNKREEERRTHRKSSKVIFALGIITAFVLALVLITSIVLLIFPVGEYDVVGDSRYSYADVIKASGISKYARLYYVNEKKAEERILAAMPYLESVTVTSYFPNRVKIEIKEFEDIYLAKHESGFCYVNGSFEILEIVEEAPSFDGFSGIFVKLENEISGEVGAVYGGEDAERAAELVVLLKEYGFYDYLDIIDVERKYDNSFIIAKRFKFVIGAMTDIGEKIDASFKVCFTDSFKREENCVIDATDKKRVVLRYVTDEIIREEFDFCVN